LNVDRVARPQFRGAGGELLVADLLAQCDEVVPRPHSLRGVCLHRNHVPQPRELPTFQGFFKTAGCQFRHRIREHAEVVRGPEPFHEKHRNGVGLLQHVSQLGRAIGGIHGNQHRTDTGGRVLQQHPPRPVRRPDGDVLSFLNSQRQQRAGDAVDFVIELPVRQPETEFLADRQPFVLRLQPREYHGVALRKRLRRAAQNVADRPSVDRGSRRFRHARLALTIRWLPSSRP
jgi:hypothetical protein